MKSARIAIYVLIGIHFIRRIYRRIVPVPVKGPRFPNLDPCIIVVLSLPGQPKLATCANLNLARDLVYTIEELAADKSLTLGIRKWPPTEECTPYLLDALMNDGIVLHEVYSQYSTASLFIIAARAMKQVLYRH